MTLFAAQVGSKKGFKKLATAKLAANDANFAVVLPKLGKGTWLVQAKYQDPGQVVAAPARTVKVTVGAKPKTSVSFELGQGRQGRQDDRLGHDQARRSPERRHDRGAGDEDRRRPAEVRREDHRQGG